MLDPQLQTPIKYPIRCICAEGVTPIGRQAIFPGISAVAVLDDSHMLNGSAVLDA